MSPPGQGKSRSARRRRARRSGQAGGQPPRQSSAVIVPIATQGTRNRPRRRRNNGVETNPYLATLLDPRNVSGVKIPDQCMFPTGTLTLTYENTYTVAVAPGDSVAIEVEPTLSSLLNPIRGGSSTTAGSVAGFTGADWQGAVSARAAVASYRPVSCMLSVEFIGNSTQDQGMVRGYIVGRGIRNNIPDTWAGLSGINESLKGPARNGMQVRWRPQDNKDLEFMEINTESATFGNNFPVIGIVLTGLISSSTVVSYAIHCNFEVIPSASSINLIETSPSPASSVMFERAMNALANPSTLYSFYSQYLAGAVRHTAGRFLQGAVNRLGDTFNRRLTQRANQMNLEYY